MKLLISDPRIPEEHKKLFENYTDAVTPVEYRDVKVESVEEFLRGSIEPNEHQVQKEISRAGKQRFELKEEGIIILKTNFLPQGQWFKARETLPGNDAALHACSIAYASDSGILMTAVRANGLIARKHIGMMASLDHSIWFHAPTRADEW